MENRAGSTMRLWEQHRCDLRTWIILFASNFSFVGSLHAGFHSGWTSQLFCQQCVRFLSPHPCWCVMAFVHLTTGILTGVRCNPGEVLQWVSLMTSDAEWLPPPTLTISSSPERRLFPTYWPDGWLLRNSGSTQSLFSVLMSIHVSQGLIFLWTLNDGPRGNMEFHSSRNGKSKCFFPERLNSITNPWLRDYSLIYWNVRAQLAATAGVKWLPGEYESQKD